MLNSSPPKCSLLRRNTVAPLLVLSFHRIYLHLILLLNRLHFHNSKSKVMEKVIHYKCRSYPCVHPPFAPALPQEIFLTSSLGVLPAIQQMQI